MEFIYVNSTDINGITVNGNNLIIKFNSGTIYEYKNAACEFSNLINADSKGKYFHQNIKNKYICNKIS